MNKKFHENGDKKNLEREVFFEIPVITTSSPSMDTDSEGSLVCKDMTKLFTESQSDEEFETSFITNNNTVNRRVSFLRTLSPGNLNASNVSRGVNELFIFSFVVCDSLTNILILLECTKMVAIIDKCIKIQRKSNHQYDAVTYAKM